MALKRQHALVAVIRVNPSESARIEVLGRHGTILAIEMIEVRHETLEPRVQRILQEVPIERSVELPFCKLPKLAAHEERLLTRPSPLHRQQAT